jgi:hypothetical protein
MLQVTRVVAVRGQVYRMRGHVLLSTSLDDRRDVTTF